MSENVELAHQVFGSRTNHYYHYAFFKRLVAYPLYYIYDCLRLFLRLAMDRQIRVVQVSPTLITFSLLREAFIVLCSRAMNRRIIVFFRGWREHVAQHLKEHALSRFLFCWVYRGADLTVVLASSFKSDLVALGWNPACIYITTTMYEEEVPVLPTATRDRKKPQFLFVGRLSELKGINELIEAGRIVSERGHDFECVLVGRGDRAGIVQEYQSLIQEYGLEERFRFTGHISKDRLCEEYAIGDVFVFPSWTEGCPNVVIEALGSGLFVIASGVGALSDIIQEESNGRIVRVKDPADLAQKMVWACTHIEVIRMRRDQIRSDARARFEAGVIVEQFREIYTRLLESDEGSGTYRKCERLENNL